MTDKTTEEKNNNSPFEGAVLGETSTPFKLATQNEVLLGALSLANQCRHSIKIFSHDLEEAIYNNEGFVRNIANVAQLHRSTYVRILIQDPDPAVKCGHLLVEEAQRLPSSIQIRRVSRDFSAQTKCFLLADDVGLLLRKHWDSYDATLMFHGGVSAIKQQRFFDRAWEAGEPEVAFRRLGM